MKIKTFRCPECQANIEIEEGRTFCYCQYCGCKIILDDEKQEIKIHKNINITKNIMHTNHHINDAEIIRETNKEKRELRNWIAAILCLIISISIPFLMMLKLDVEKKAAQSNGKINAGFYRDLIGENYKTVQAHFESAGFTNIDLIDLNDSGIAFWNAEKVESISIGGVTRFDSDNWFDPDTKVVISYH